ncbi:concanavalin A-like lectin/glucanase domain-containing protein, partial [Sporodiniella umbellata]
SKKAVRNKERSLWRPLLYSLGWNKKLSYCIAYSNIEAIDVTKRYVQDWNEVLKRRDQISERELDLFLDDLTNKYQKLFSYEKKREINRKRIKELIELQESCQKRMVKNGELLGRQSGSTKWRSMRGELGTSVNTESQSLGVFNLLGSSTQTNKNIVRLTESKISQVGAVYHPQSINFHDVKGVEIEFAIRITGQGADGMAFVVQASHKDALGEGGCELGYGGIKNSIAVEFDTYQSLDRCTDPSSNHISIHARQPPYPNSAHHDYSLACNSLIPTLASGKWIEVKVQMDKEHIQVGLLQNNQYTSILNVELDVMSYLNNSKEAWVGFTASTGGLAQTHEIQWNQLIVHYK